MPARKRTAPTPTTSGVVTVTVVEPHLVYHDGEQRGGTIHGVPADTAAHWQKHGWATITAAVDTAPTDATTE
ncbi:hypothetical protein [Mycolicibacterium sp. 050158]|uniref:hypothetical protein n=1 Tax=Mycolicibacterium sp. 050158 TaxID=3090602 RepID=UPI00299F12BD|nr:hypothetical protein [Mycolicibacterium sp. 050158]MDX1890116.1 hypothetical protein [Mycolicibacterium sp. 050158]